MKKRLGIISLFVILFVTFIFVWNFSYQKGREDAYIPLKGNNLTPNIPSETGVFKRSKFAIDYANMPFDKNHERTLKTYYKNRAFHGAPPNIPHPIVEEQNVGGNSCLKCHENGGFVDKFNAYAPVVPHPELVSCKQCHVEQKKNTTFKPGNYSKVNAPSIGNNNALLTSPPVIPHQIQMHENCLSCHAGPSAPIEIRVTHPERVNCRQCHVINNKEMKDIGVFIKEIKND